MTPLPVVVAALLSTVPPPRLSEVRTDSVAPNGDIEYIEIEGLPGTSLDGLSLIVLGDADEEIGPLFGNSGFIESLTPLDGYAIPDDRALLVHSSGMLLTFPDVYAELRLEDVDNLTVLLVRNAKCAAGDDLDLDDDGVLDLEPWSEVLDSIGLVVATEGVVSEWTYGAAKVQSTGFSPAYHAVRCPDTGEWSAGGVYFKAGVEDTPGACNAPCEGSLCAGDFDQDGSVGASDITVLLASWGALDTAADLNNDGTVGAADLTMLLAAWGPCQQ